MKKITFLIIGIVISSLGFAQTVVFEDNFDAYTVGEGIAYQSTDWWQWDNQNPSLGNAYDALISDAQSVSASNSMNVVNDKDIVYRFGNPTSGIFEAEFNMYINDDATQGGYFNVEHVFGSNWAFSFFFGEDGNITYDVVDNVVLGTYTKNVWFNVKLNFNINDDITTVYIDNDSLTSFPFTYSASGLTTDLNRLDCINFYGANGTTPPANSNYFIDDFKYTEVVAETPANLIIDETEIVVDANQFNSETIHFENDGAITMNYRAYAVYDYNPTFAGADTDYDVLTYVTTSDLGSAPASDPVGTQRKFTTRYYNSSIQNLIGLKIDSVYYLSGVLEGDSIELSILDRGSFIDNTDLGSRIQSQSYYNLAHSSEQYAVLDQPYLLNGEEISVEFQMGVADPDSALLYVEFTEVGLPVGATNGNYVNFNSGYADSYYNNYVLVYCSGTLWPKWLNVDAANGTLDAGASDDITLTFNTADLTIGETYTSKVVFGCDAPNKEFSEIPVTITVISGIDAANTSSKIGVLSYPNPTTNYFNISADAEITNIEVVSQSGQVVYSNAVNSKSVKIDMETLPEGVYFAKVTVNNTVVTKKIIKE